MLAGLGDELAAGRITLAQGESRLRAEGLDRAELESLLGDLDRAMARPTAAQSAAAQLAYRCADLVADRRLRVVLGAAWARLLMSAGALDEAADAAADAERLADDVADMRLRSLVTSLRASVAGLADDDHSALELRRRAVRIAREVGDPRVESVETTALGSQLAALGENEEAVRQLRRAVEIARPAGLHDCEAQAFYFLARLAQRSDDLSAAVEMLSAATAAALAATEETEELLQTVGRLANLQYELGVSHRFEELLRLGERLARGAGVTELRIHYLANLGLTAAAGGRRAEGAGLLRQARDLAVRTADGVAVARIDHDLAGVGDDRPTEAPPPVEQGAVAERLVALADEVTAGRDINDALEALPPSVSGEAAGAAVDEVVELASEAADERGQWAYALVTLTLFWAPETIADGVRYRLLSLWGTFNLSAFRIDDAVWAFDQAAQAATRMGEPRAVVAALTNAGNALRRGGRPTEASEIYATAVALADEPETLAFAALNAGTALGDLRRYGEALRMYAAALDVFRRDPQRHPAALATALLNHGEILLRQGDRAGAERELQQALRIQREQGMTGQEGVTLGLLGHVRLDRGGGLAGGLAHLLRALEIAEEQPDRWNAALWALDLASLAEASQMRNVAAGFYQRALDHSLVTGDRRTAAKARIGLGSGIRELLGLWREYGGGADDVVAARVALRLARTYRAKAVGIPAAVAAAERGDFQALRDRPRLRDRRALRQVYRWLDAADRALARQAHDDSLAVDAAAQRAVLRRLEGRPRSALRALLRARRSALAVAPAYASPDGVIADAVIDVLRQDLGNWRAARRRLDAALDAAEEGTAALPSGEVRVLFQQRTALRYQTAFECAMRMHDTDGAFGYAERSKNIEGRRALLFRRDEVRLASPTLQEVRDVARDLGNTVIIEFLPTATTLYAFVFAPSISADQILVEIPDLGLLALLQRLWQPLQDSYLRLKEPAAAFDPAALDSWRSAVATACAETGRQVLDPVAARLEGHRFDAVVFVPHSVLHCLPLHACPLNGGELWGDRYRVSYAPSAAILAAVAGAPQPGSAFAAFANPTGDLPFSEVEAAAALAGRVNARSWSGSEATATALLEALPVAARLHLACHATRDSLRMSEGEPVRLAQIQRDVTLPPGSTVYLSACETGTVTPGIDDEFTSLAGGMLFAGAASVVATHWRVRDACALVVADLFYAPDHRGLPDAERLRQAVAGARSMSERDVVDRLTALYSAHPTVPAARWEWLLRPYSRARQDVRPFASPADWAAFFLAGRP